jgi:hypothetical protein
MPGANVSDKHLTRRKFLEKATAVSVGAAATLGNSAPGEALSSGTKTAKVALLPSAEKLPSGGKPIKLFCCDLNWIHPADHRHTVVPSLPQDWAYIDPAEYFAWHRDFGVNIFFLQGYIFCGYAYYPTKLGPIAPGPGAELFPKLFRMSQKAGLPFCGYFSIALDPIVSNLRFDWVVPTSRNYGAAGLLAPESPWTELLCARITEFLKLYPVEWINFDCFNYGKYNSNDFPVQPSVYVKGPFKEIIGREMPEKAAEITPEESMKYKREIMARQFHRIKEAMYKGNPGTKANFNVPFFKPAEPMWVDHPMLNECDQLVAESSDDIVNWLLEIRKPHQRVMTTIVGRPADKGVCDPNSWKKWYEAGCDFFAYAHGIPPDFRPHAGVMDQVEIARNAYQQMP